MQLCTKRVLTINRGNHAKSFLAPMEQTYVASRKFFYEGPPHRGRFSYTHTGWRDLAGPRTASKREGGEANVSKQKATQATSWGCRRGGRGHKEVCQKLTQLMTYILGTKRWKGWLAIIAKLNPISLFISLLLVLKKAFDNVKIGKWKVKVVLA